MISLPPDPPALTTTRLLLRPMRSEDEGALAALWADDEVMRYASDTPLPSVAAMASVLDSVRSLLGQMPSIEWVITLRATQQTIGTCCLYHFDAAARSAEVACLLARDHWGQGLMAEALQAVTAYARDVLALSRLAADIDVRNQRSLALFAKLGFRPRSATRHELPL